MQRNASLKAGVKSGPGAVAAPVARRRVIRHALAEILQRGDVHDPVFEAR